MISNNDGKHFSSNSLCTLSFLIYSNKTFSPVWKVCSLHNAQKILFWKCLDNCENVQIKILIAKCQNVLTTLDKNALIFVLKTGFGNNKLLFWTKIFNIFDPIQHDLTSLNIITLLNSSNRSLSQIFHFLLNRSNFSNRSP